MILIRKENFGGIIFNTKNGIQIKIDKEGFDVFMKYVQGQKNFSPKQAEFINQLKNELELSFLETYKFFDIQFSHPYQFEILSSPILVDLQITNQCNLKCPHCYASSDAYGKHTPYKEIIKVIKQCEKYGVFEIALGGGEPTLHPQFTQILKEIHKRGMVVNYTTNGKRLTENILKATKKYCGAIALSLENINKKFEQRRGFKFSLFEKSIKKIKNRGIKLVFQITISFENYKDLAQIAKYIITHNPYGVIFLTYKPVGRGQYFDSPLIKLPPQEFAANFKQAIDILVGKTKIGYDCCMANGLIGHNMNDDKTIQGCSATRSSIAISSFLNVSPCSFTTQIPLGNTKRDDLLTIWNNLRSGLFRKKMHNNHKEDPKCSKCQYQNNCLGGCPAYNLLNCIRKQS